MAACEENILSLGRQISCLPPTNINYIWRLPEKLCGGHINIWRQPVTYVSFHIVIWLSPDKIWIIYYYALDVTLFLRQTRALIFVAKRCDSFLIYNQDIMA